MITVGALNLSNCRLSYAIPLCLTVAGCAYLLIPLLSAALDWNASNSYCPVMISVLVCGGHGRLDHGLRVRVFGHVAFGEAGRSPVLPPRPSTTSRSSCGPPSSCSYPVMLVVSVVVFRKYGKHNVHAATMPSSRY
ncbi:hypothetical protein MTO96_050015 [Rhipicephalus appendiculatus]